MRTPSSSKRRLDLAPPWADRFIWGLSPSITARYFSAGPSDSTLRWTPCPPKYSKRWLQVGLGCLQLSLSCPFRRLHTFRFLRPARLRTPLLGYGAPHLSARGTSPLLNNALLGARFPFADHPGAIAWWLESKGWVQPLLRLFTRPWDKGLHFKSTGVFTGPFADWCLTQEAEVRSRRCCGNRRATGHRVKVSALR